MKGLRVLLIYPEWSDIYSYARPFTRILSFFPPIGLCYLASLLKENSMDCEILDCESENADIEKILKQIEDYEPQAVGISSTTPLVEKANFIAQKIKEFFDIPIVLGGNHITLVGAEAMDSGNFDFGVIGEGEIVFPMLVKSLQQGWEQIRKVPNIIYRYNGINVATPTDKNPINLDSLPFPDRSKLNTKKYKRLVRDKIKVFTSVKASRGCPLNCYFCSEQIIYPVKIRFRSPDNIISELEEISSKYSEIQHIFFNDDVLTIKKSWIMELLDKIIKRKYEFTFEGETVVRYFDEEIAEKMALAGFDSIFFGLETGALEIMRRIGKNITLEQVVRAVNIAKSFGLVTRGSVIIGHPFETKDTIKKTIDFIYQLDNLDELYVNIATPYPGTKLREMAQKGEGGIRLINKSFSSLSKYEAVIELENISSWELKKYQKIAILKFYSKPKRMLSYLRRLKTKAIVEVLINFTLFIMLMTKNFLFHTLKRKLKSQSDPITQI